MDKKYRLSLIEGIELNEVSELPSNNIKSRLPKKELHKCLQCPALIKGKATYCRPCAADRIANSMRIPVRPINQSYKVRLYRKYLEQNKLTS